MQGMALKQEKADDQGKKNPGLDQTGTIYSMR